MRNTCDRFKSWAILIVLCTFSNVALKAQGPEKEPVLKAAFIYNFTKYIEWNGQDREIFVIGIIGNTPVYEPLDAIATTKTVGEKRIIIRKFNTPGEITDCNILFISSANTYPLSSILENTSKGTLTISESPGFARLGTAINFVVLNDKLKFEANVKSLIDEGLKASSQLLKLAIIVD
ncbi:MAG: YfiR family protein [Ginsengibacter sp.]